METPNKRGRLRLDPELYRELRMKILQRDGWKCQRCGRRDQLEIHHLVRRSQSGADSERNLLLLCSECHRTLHLKSITDQLELLEPSEPDQLNDISAEIAADGENVSARGYEVMTLPKKFL